VLGARADDCRNIHLKGIKWLTFCTYPIQYAGTWTSPRVLIEFRWGKITVLTIEFNFFGFFFYKSVNRWFFHFHFGRSRTILHTLYKIYRKISKTCSSPSFSLTRIFVWIRIFGSLKYAQRRWRFIFTIFFCTTRGVFSGNTSFFFLIRTLLFYCELLISWWISWTFSCI